MFTLFAVLIFFVLIVPLGIATHQWLFQEADGFGDPEWDLYQQRYD